MCGALYTAAACKHKNDGWDTHMGLFRVSSVLFTALQPLNYFITLPDSHDLITLLPISPQLPRGDFCLSTKWFDPLGWMPEVTSCPTSCRTMLAEYSGGKPRRPQWTWTGSSTSCGTQATVWTLTSPSTHTWWPRASWRRGGTAAWMEPRSVHPSPPSAIS